MSAERETLTTRNGLLYRGEVVVDCPEADRIAFVNHLWSAERVVDFADRFGGTIEVEIGSGKIVGPPLLAEALAVEHGGEK